MSQESETFSPKSLINNDSTQFFVGTPSLAEVQQYFLRQRRQEKMLK